MRDYVLVGCGAALGAVARFCVLESLSLIASSPDIWTTLAINIVGCFLMGRTRPRPFWGTGFLGGFTTFSAFELGLAQAPAPVALALLLSTIAGCIVAWWLGDTAYRRSTAKRPVA